MPRSQSSWACQPSGMAISVRIESKRMRAKPPAVSICRILACVGCAPLPIIGLTWLKLVPLSDTAKSLNVRPPESRSGSAWAESALQASAKAASRNGRRPDSFCLALGERLYFKHNSLKSGLYYEAVMTRMDMRRGAPVELSIIHVDVEICEKSTPGCDPFDPFQRQVEMGMRRMRPVAHGVDDHHLGVAHQGERVLRHADEVVDVEDAAEAEAERRCDAVV